MDTTVRELVTIEANISSRRNLSFDISNRGFISADIKLPEYVGSSEYEGEYTVIPSTSEQVLYTSGLHMEDNVTVTEIPYAEVSNVYGTTISIVS